ncbi:hypothetical protein LTR53_005266 [Teratosphaeriaceae sp. CCFEE 6253]|nr:hypothetical protein LTR53_005266 [Teratosphaeriaceae sp. CCFEE 6253]
MLALALGLLLRSLTHALPLNAPLLPEYDYIIAGGGIAGLTVANRLSEDFAVNVLLLEAGPADHDELFIQVPGMIGDGIGSIYDWNLSTVPQVALDGAPRSVPQGYGLGGGSLINGMLWNRGGISDYDDTVQLGNPSWSWDDMMPYFTRSETYHPVDSIELAVNYSIEANMSAHGTTGAVNVSFAHWFWDSSALLFDALNELGVPTAYDPNQGLIAGASFLPLSLDPVAATRSTARRAYYDPVATRPNLWVSTGQHVTQILFDSASTNTDASVTSAQDTSAGQGTSPVIPGGIFGGTTTLNVSGTRSHSPSSTKHHLLRRLWSTLTGALFYRQDSGSQSTNIPSVRAVGVEFASDARSSRQTVRASREVIVAAGALHSPQLLMLSGIGPSSVLQPLDLPVNIDLPGVGSNLHDHAQVWTWYPYNNSAHPSPLDFFTEPSFAENAWASYWANRTGPLTSGAFDGVAFPALALIVNGSTDISDAASAQIADQYLPTGTDPSVVLGYARELQLLTSALADPIRASYEIINANSGALTVANMRPFSRGTVTVASSQPFDPPIIDPRYSSNPIDAQVLLAAIRFNERLIVTNALSELDPVQMYPAAGATDEDILQWINTHMQTEYHPVGTCAMMPLELGGVVSPDLLVYGTANLRVVDSSIIPVLPAAHLQAVVYGIAEKVDIPGDSRGGMRRVLIRAAQAADIIKAANFAPATALFSYDPPSTSPAAGTPSSISAEDVVTTYTTVVATQTVYI